MSLGKILNSVLGGGSSGDGGSTAMSEAALRELKKVKTPKIKDMERNYKKYAFDEKLQALNLAPSALEDLQYDKESMDAQKEALESLRQRGKEGLTQEDQLVFNQLRDKAQSDLQANQASMLQQQAQQGTSNSGNALMSQMMNQQNSAQQSMNNASNQALASIQAKRDALSRGAQLASNIGQAQLGVDTTKMNARDTVNRYNNQNSQNIMNQNIAGRSATNRSNTQLSNQQQDVNKELVQQNFSNQMARATGQANQMNAMASNMQARAAADAQANSAMTAGLIQAGGSALSNPALYSDVRAKEHIEKPSSSSLKEQVREMLANLDPYEYDYKDPEAHGEGRRTGIMAQDLEKSDLGRELVSEDETGTKRVDINKAASLNLAATSDIQDRLQNLEELLMMVTKGR